MRKVDDLFLQLDASFIQSALVDSLVGATGVRYVHAVGYIVVLWGEVMQTNIAGALGRRSDQWIEHMAQWDGEPGAFAAWVRREMLAEDGSIIGWNERYGALDAARRKERQRWHDRKPGASKETPRRKAGDSTETPRSESGVPSEAPPESAGVVAEETRRESGGNAEPSLSSSSVVSVVKETFTTQELPELTQSPASAVDLVTAFLTEFDFGQYRDLIEGQLRAAAVPLGIIAVLKEHLLGDPYQKQTPAIVGRAFAQYVGDVQFRGRIQGLHFAGFVRRVAGKQAQRNEEQRLVVEAKLKQDREAEEAQATSVVDLFAADDPERFAELQRQANKETPRGGIGREFMVKARLIELIRAEGGKYAAQA